MSSVRSSAREQVSLPSPPPASQLVDFPEARIRPTVALYRVTRRGRGPWWFSSQGGGRFDLSAPEGTCYLACEPLAALLEVLGPRSGGLVAREFFAERRLHSLRVPEERRLADCASRRATAFGVTLEIGAVVPYDRSRAWAHRFHEAGREGVRYRLRHDPQGSLGIALFGPAGEASWPAPPPAVLEPALLAELSSETGIRVIGRPSRKQLTVADLPDGLK